MRKHFLRLTVTLFSALLAVALGSPVLPAQDNMGGQSATSGQGNMSEAAAKLEKMAAALQLTPAQKQQVRPILMEEAPKLKALKSDTSTPPLQKAMKMRQITEATDAKLQPILTPEQYQKLQQMQTQERQQMMQQRENR
jgi:Spy/CpxP family protein refolding chaperone